MGPMGQGPERGWKPDEVGYWAISLAARVMTRIAKVLAPFEMNAAQFFILETCFRGEAETVTHLSEVLPYDQAHISRQVDRLASKGLLSRRRSRADRRIVRLNLTEKGRAVVPAVVRVVSAQDVEMTASITAGEKESLVAVTRKILASQ